MKTRTFNIVIAGLVLAGGFLVIVYGQYQEYLRVISSEMQSIEHQMQLHERLALKDSDVVFNPGKPVTLIVYTDTDCEFCRSYKDTVLELLDNHRDTLTVSFRYSFLPIYERSYEEGLLLECVATITNSPEIYVQFQDALFDIESSRTYDPELLLDAASAFAPRENIIECQNSEVVQEHVRNVHYNGALLGVGRVPHTFIFSDNSQAFQAIGNRSYSSLEDLILQAL